MYLESWVGKVHNGKYDEIKMKTKGQGKRTKINSQDLWLQAACPVRPRRPAPQIPRHVYHRELHQVRGRPLYDGVDTLPLGLRPPVPVVRVDVVEVPPPTRDRRHVQVAAGLGLDPVHPRLDAAEAAVEVVRHRDGGLIRDPELASDLVGAHAVQEGEGHLLELLPLFRRGKKGDVRAGQVQETQSRNKVVVVKFRLDTNKNQTKTAHA